MTFISFAIGVAIIVWAVGKAVDGPTPTPSLTITIHTHSVHTSSDYWVVNIETDDMLQGGTFVTQHRPSNIEIGTMLRTVNPTYAAKDNAWFDQRTLAVTTELIPGPKAIPTNTAKELP